MKISLLLTLSLLTSLTACLDQDQDLSEDISALNDEPGSLRCGLPTSPLFPCLSIPETFEFNGLYPFCKGYAGNVDVPGKEPWTSSFPGVANDSRNMCEVGGSTAYTTCRTTCGDQGDGKGAGYTSGCAWAYSSGAGRYVGRCYTRFGQIPNG